jgi:E-phenylitaconyl-CoA hydratase
MEIALACDIRIASNNATFGLPEVKVGSIPAVGGIQWLMRSVGHSRAMTMILSGESIDAVTAEKIGLVSAVHSPEELLPKAIELAKTIAANAPLAVRAARLLAREGLNMSVSQAMLLEQFVWGTLRDTEDRVEGRRAFAEKRKPVYRGR